MTAVEFLANFGEVANAPGGVVRLRELVLSLACQGLLVGQTLADEPADILLDKNDEERRMIAKSDRRADDSSQPLLSAEDCWQIPASWRWRGLADLVLFIDYRGKTPRKINQGVRLLTAKNVRPGSINFSPEEFLSEQDYVEWMKRGLPKSGDVLFTTEAPMGNAAVVNLSERFALAQRVICFRAYGALVPEFLALQIRTQQFQFILEKNGTGVTAKGIKASKLKCLPIAIPPLAEQLRIVAKVDELMALCDQLEAQQQERERRFPVLSRTCHARFAEAPTPANLNRIFDETGSVSPSDLRRSILTLAVSGHLVSSTTQVDPDTVGDHVEFVNGYAFKSEWFQASGVKVCRNVNVNHGILDWREPAHVSEEIAEEFERFTLREGDIVLSLDRPIITTGLKVARIRRQDLPCLLLQRVAKPVPKSDRLELDYFYLWLQSPAFIDSIDPGRSNGVPHISTKQVQKLAFRLPLPAEQRRIVAKVDELMALVDQLEAQQQERDKLAEAFAKACVASFTGTTQLERPEKMKAPKTELVSLVTLGKKSKPAAQAPLAQLLIQNKGTLPAKSLWQQSGLTIDAFYQQLKTEIAQGWIAPPAEAEMKILEEA